MVDKRARQKGRKTSKRFIAIPLDLLRHPAYTELSPAAVKLLVDLVSQYNGRNNGCLYTAPKRLGPMGWDGKDRRTLWKARDELKRHRIIIETKRHAQRQSALYALTFQPIDESPFHYMPSTNVAGNDWKLYRGTKNAPQEAPAVQKMYHKQPRKAFRGT